MPRKPPSPISVLVVAGLLVAFVVWTLLVVRTSVLQPLDAATVPPRLQPLSGTAQIAAAFALLTWSGVTYAAVLGVAWWAYRHRLRNLSAALVITVALGWAAAELVKFLVGRPRPPGVLPLLTSSGSAYPSGHLTAMTAAVVALGATFVVARRDRWFQLRWRIGGAVIILAVGVNRWLLDAHRVTDLVGSVLLGALVTSIALVTADVSVVPPFSIGTTHTTVQMSEEQEAPRYCAVIYNPLRILDLALFRRSIEYELRNRGWQKPIWLETTEDDPGHGMTQTAVEREVDLVLGAGGDGTIRVVCAGLSGTGIPFGLIPAGTGNLLARNLGIPLDARDALAVAFDGRDKRIDLVKITVDDGRVDRFAVMAGIGIDASIMSGTNADLKRAMGSAAYFLSAARHTNHPALHATIAVDDQPAIRRRAHVIVVGNVGYLQGGIPLLPDARADDGLIDLLVASPRRPADWVRLTARVLARRKDPDEQLDRRTGKRISILVEERDHYQLDGDTVGECSSLEAEIEPGALLLRVPSRRASAP